MSCVAISFSRRAGLLAALLAVIACSSFATAAEKAIEITVAAGKIDRANSPVRVPVTLTETPKGGKHVTLTGPNGQKILAQITANHVLGKKGHELNFILPSLKAGETMKLSTDFAPADEPKSVYNWKDTKDVSMDLRHGDRAILRYMYAPIVQEDKEKRAETYKPYHHVFDPKTGETLLTKGPGGKFPHHRGLYFGFNKCTYGPNFSKKADTWHCTGDAYESHEGVLGSEVGGVLGRHVVAVDWHGMQKEVFAKEDRELTVYNVPGGSLIEFATVLRTTGEPVRLDGDPQHAGFQFRAAAEVTDVTNKQTYYIRPDGVGAKGATKNWPGDKDQVDLPWKGMSIVVGGNRYTVANLDRAENPKPARFSERDYGRFGSYFEYEVTAEKPLQLNYRIWVIDGETTGEAIAALAKDFDEPVEVTVK